MGVDIEREGPFVTVTLDWPERRNAVGIDDVAELTAAIRSGLDGETRVLILTGNGAFCAGANLRHVADRTVHSAASHRETIKDSAHTLMRTIIDAPVPTIAAVDGPAVGLGCDLALVCDCRLIGPDGWLMQGWGRMGVIPGAGGELFLRLRNPSLLWKLLAEQPRIGAVDAERWGLGEAVAEGTAIAAARRRAIALAELSPEVLRTYTDMYRTFLRREAPDHLELCADVQSRLLTGSDVVTRVATVLGPESGRA